MRKYKREKYAILNVIKVREIKRNKNNGKRKYVTQTKEIRNMNLRFIVKYNNEIKGRIKEKEKKKLREEK